MEEKKSIKSKIGTIITTCSVIYLLMRYTGLGEQILRLIGEMK